MPLLGSALKRGNARCSAGHRMRGASNPGSWGEWRGCVCACECVCGGYLSRKKSPLGGENRLGKGPEPQRKTRKSKIILPKHRKKSGGREAGRAATCTGHAARPPQLPLAATGHRRVLKGQRHDQIYILRCSRTLGSSWVLWRPRVYFKKQRRLIIAILFSICLELHNI